MNKDDSRPTGADLVQSDFRVEAHIDGRATVLAVSGELDLGSSPRLEPELERVTASDAELVILDLREVSFMDSTGLHLIVRAHQRLEDRGRRFGLVNGSRQVQRLLSLTGVGELLTVADTPEELLEQS